jgi:6-phosphogluconate dehydrogenase
MQLGMVGLGRMGGNIVRRLTQKKHRCVVFDKDPAAIKGVLGEGVSGSADLEDVVDELEKPRAVWVMLPAGSITEQTVMQLGRLCQRTSSRRLSMRASGRARSKVFPISLSRR